MSIHKEGYRILLVFFVVLVAINLALLPLHHGRGLFFYLILTASILFYFFLVYFFRKPKRKIQPDDGLVYSPADGTIVAIEEVKEDLYYHEKRLQVSIFMSPLNIHVNYCPISGLIDYVNHEPGNHLVAWHPKSSIENERTSVVIHHANGKNLMIRQIAGAVARRIVTYCQPEKTVYQGEQLGFIKFGSRVDVFLPLNTKLNVELDQKVKGNKTILANF
jgi:phosphatidylserine decarboxylase